MAIFFLLIGLEIEREIHIGELSDLKSASLPIIAAIGGMALPALFYFLFNKGTKTQGGIGFTMSIYSQRRHPLSLLETCSYNYSGQKEVSWKLAST